VMAARRMASRTQTRITPAIFIYAHSFGVHSLWLAECPEILGVGRLHEIEGILREAPPVPVV
jgi:hypothetical protein